MSVDSNKYAINKGYDDDNLTLMNEILREGCGKGPNNKKNIFYKTSSLSLAASL